MTTQTKRSNLLVWAVALLVALGVLAVMTSGPGSARTGTTTAATPGPPGRPATTTASRSPTTLVTIDSGPTTVSIRRLL